MTTIITVHGTNVSGPEQGGQWWQKGGTLHTELKTLLKTNNGLLNLQPLIWDGRNSETSRRAAAEDLLRAMEALETTNEAYCVVGHSHGGSVAAHALHLAASERNKLPNLTCCITVGTPFIKFVKSRWLFSRSKLLEKAALVSTAAFAFLFSCFIIVADYRVLSLEALLAYALLIGPVLALYIGLRWINSKRFFIYQPGVLRFLEQNYASRLMSVRHESDEAINGLRSLRLLRIPLFDRNFAVPALSFLSLFLIPAVALLGSQSDSFVRAISHSEWPPLPVTSNWLENVAQAITTLALALGTSVYRSLEWIGTSFRPPGNPLGVSLALAALITPIILSVVSLLVTTVSVAIATLLSSGLSRLLNPLTWTQIREAAFGNDTLGEVSPDASHSAPWSPTPSAVLPIEIAGEISALSNTAAPESVEKLRTGMNRLLLSDDREAKEFFFSEYISWDILIHTSYFRSPRFGRLLAYAIASKHAERGDITFPDHPERALISRWHDEIT